ncbi:MAG TPA: S-layer homology domain-containing protein [Firmicutes bacterium]|nr:S-layer homology domain-containing protein [Bacillota bacterium]
MRNLKKVIALIAVFAMMVSTVAFAATFDDVDTSNSYSEAIDTLSNLSILTGDDENNDGVMSFRPEDTITRAEIAVIVARLQGYTGTVAQTDTIFSDVTSSHWASGYIAMAANQQIVNGNGDGTFAPDNPVQYQEVIKMIMETLGYKPFANDNGGYPTGYLVAAQQYGVLDGVIGGGEGAQATRGQVAQMVYNALDTPIMDRLTYGQGNQQYYVLDGQGGRALETIMSRYLRITKVKGIVTENDVTTLDGAKSIDTLNEQRIRINITETFDNQFAVNETQSFYVGDTNAVDFLGKQVVAYADTNTNSTSLRLISVTEAEGANTEISFPVSSFESFDGTTMKYMQNETDRSATSARVTSGAPVIYNGIADDMDATELSNILSDATLSGQVTLVDNDESAGYDVIFVDIATAGVVSELSSRGVVTFLNTVGDRATKNSVNRIEFNTTSSDSIINITQNGQPYDYTALKQWDVLSIITNTDANGTYMEIEVLGNSYVDGSVSRVVSSDESATGSAYTIDGVDYPAASGGYLVESLRAGSSGRFYIDQFGKIVAYNRSVTVPGNPGTTISDNYAYVLNATVNISTWGTEVPMIQLMNKDGQIGTFEFASTVTIENPTAEFNAAAGDSATDEIQFQYDNATGNVDAALQSIIGQIVTYNDNGNYIRGLTLAADYDAVADNYSTLTLYAEGSGSYDEDTQLFTINGDRTRRPEVNEDTIVFYIGTAGSNESYGAAVSDVDDCQIGTGAELNTMTVNQVAAYDVEDSTGVANVIVLYNTNAGVSASTGIAYVTSVGTASYDGSRVLSVSYIQDGEEKTAYTTDTVVDDLSDSTVPGSLFKFGFSGDQISSATTYLTFDGTVRDRINSSANDAGIPNVRRLGTGVNDEEIYFGAVVDKSGSRLTIVPYEATQANGIPTPDSIQTISLGNVTANYYLYDPARSGNAKFQFGSVGDIYVDKTLAADGATTEGVDVVINGQTITAPVYGACDYVFIRLYERQGDVIDYMAYEYDWDYAD